MTIRQIRDRWSQALRHELGCPPDTPMLDTLATASGPMLDLPIALEIMHVAAETGHDVVFSGWERTTNTAPSELAVALCRDEQVRLIAPCFLWAADDDAPLTIVSEHDCIAYRLSAEGRLEPLPDRSDWSQIGRVRALDRVAARAAALCAAFGDSAPAASDRHRAYPPRVSGQLLH